MMNAKHICACLATGTILSMGFAAHAAEVGKDTSLDALLDMDIEQLANVSIGKTGFFDRDSDMTPGTQFVVDIDDVQKHAPARTLYDVLDNGAPGINMSRHEQHGALIGVRGMMIDNNAKTPVMLDGQLLSQRVHFGYTVGLESPLIGDLKQAEVSLSPNAVVMGGGSVNGYINLTPKNGTDNPGGFASYEYGTKDMAHVAQTGYGYQYGPNKDVYMYAGVVSAEGYTADTGWGEEANMFSENAQPTFIGKGRVGGYGEAGYRLASYWNHGNFKMNTFVDKLAPHTGTPPRREYFERTMAGISPKYTVEFDDKNSLELIGAAELHDYSANNEDTFTNFPTRVKAGGSETHVEGKTIFRTTELDKNAIAVGGALGRRMFFNEKNILGDDPEVNDESLDFSWKELALFGEDVIDVTDKLQVTGGLRYDVVYYGTYNGWAYDEEDHVSPRVAAAYKIDETTTVKTSYQHGFRYPDAVYHTWKAFWDGFVPGAGLNLHSETVDSYEANLHKEFPEHKLVADMGVYYNEYTDALFWDSPNIDDGYVSRDTWIAVKERDGAVYDSATGTFDETNGAVGWYGQFVNALSPFRTTGTEFRLGWQPMDDLELRFNYTYAQILEAPSLEQYRFPKHLFKGGFRKYFLEKSLALDVNGTFTDNFDTVHLGYNPVFENTRFMLDAALSYDLNESIAFKLMGENLLKDNVPSVNNQPNDLKKGLIGEGARGYYMQARVKF